jgi:ribonuclease R
LNELYVEGLVHVTSLSNDYYQYDATGQRLVGERSGRVYRLADPLKVRVVRVSLEDRKLDFEPAGGAARGGKKRRRAERASRTRSGGRFGRRREAR